MKIVGMSEDYFTSDEESVSVARTKKYSPAQKKSNFGVKKQDKDTTKDKKDYKFPKSMSEFEKSKSQLSMGSANKIKGVKENSTFAFPGSGGFRTENNLDEISKSGPPVKETPTLNQKVNVNS